MNETLLVHAIVALTIVVTVVISLSLISSKVSSIVISAGGTLFKLEGVVGNPCNVVVLVVAELTCLGEDTSAHFGGGGDVGGVDLGGCRGSGDGGEEDGELHFCEC